MRGAIAAWHVLGLCLAWALTGCGGAAGEAQAPVAEEPLPSLAGRVTDGWAETDVGSLQITVKGNVGTARTAEGRKAPVDGSDYLVSLDQLSAPYLLTNAATSIGGLYAVAVAPGTANLTPLTTLMTAELLGAEPAAVFAALGQRGGFTAASEASLAEAQARVRRYLQRAHAFEVPAALGDFVTTRFDRVPGDLMYDTVRALVARIGVAGDIGAAVSALAQESARCKAERATFTGDDGDGEICPYERSNTSDVADGTVRVLRVANRFGDRLALRARGEAVLDAQLHLADGQRFDCAGEACRAIALGPEQADRRRTIRFDGVTLRGPGGQVVLQGQVTSAVPGVALPGLPCTTNVYYLIDAVAQQAQGYCALPDDFGLGAAGGSAGSGATRRVYTFGDGGEGPLLEVVVEGSQVVRALLYRVDPNTGRVTPLNQCRDGGCGGASLGERRVDESLGVPVVLQPIALEQVVMAAVQADGSLSTMESVTLQATLTGYYVDDPAASLLQPLPCAPRVPTLEARLSDSPALLRVCDPVDAQGFTLRGSSVGERGAFVYNAASLWSDGFGSFSIGHSVTVVVAADGTIASVTLDPFGGPRFTCEGSACTGVQVSAPDAQGQRSVSMSGTVLRERDTAGLIVDRRATLSGQFLAPPPS